MSVSSSPTYTCFVQERLTFVHPPFETSNRSTRLDRPATPLYILRYQPGLIKTTSTPHALIRQLRLQTIMHCFSGHACVTNKSRKTKRYPTISRPGQDRKIYQDARSIRYQTTGPKRVANHIRFSWPIYPLAVDKYNNIKDILHFDKGIQELAGSQG